MTGRLHHLGSYLWRLEDLDDDGVADKREKILGSMEFDGRANQHGPYLGPNGRLYLPVAILATTSLALMEAAPDTVGRPGFFRAGRTAVMSEWKGREGSIRLTSFLPRMETCSLPALYLTASEGSGTTP